MKSFLPFLAFAVLLTSCSSLYKSGQTPDDVYFSPGRPHDEYARVEKQDDRMYGNRYDDQTLEDRYLRMKTHNRRYAFLENDYDCYCYGSNYYRYYDYNRINNYYYNPGIYGSYGYYSGYAYNPYYYNPYYKNPYYSGVIYGNVNPVYNKPRKANLHVYDANPYTPNTSKGSRTFGLSGSEDNNYRGSGSNAGGFLRNVFGTGSNSNSGSSSSNTAPTSNNSSSGSSSSGSGSSHAPVRKF